MGENSAQRAEQEADLAEVSGPPFADERDITRTRREQNQRRQNMRTDRALGPGKLLCALDELRLYEWFTEEFDTQDLLDAKAILDTGDVRAARAGTRSGNRGSSRTT